MADVNFTDDSVEADPNESDAIRNLREANKRNEVKAKAGEAAIRELAFVKAGLDFSNPQVELLMDSYKGELTTEAIREQAVKYRLLSDESDGTPDPNETPVSDGSDQTQRRSALGSDALEPGAPIPDSNPMGSAYTEFNRLRSEGSTSEEASAAVLGKIFEEARNGNDKFVFDASTWQGTESARSR
jgi:hypothetical protein